MYLNVYHKTTMNIIVITNPSLSIKSCMLSVDFFNVNIAWDEEKHIHMKAHEIKTFNRTFLQYNNI